MLDLRAEALRLPPGAIGPGVAAFGREVESASVAATVGISALSEAVMDWMFFMLACADAMVAMMLL